MEDSKHGRGIRLRPFGSYPNSEMGRLPKSGAGIRPVESRSYRCSILSGALPGRRQERPEIKRAKCGGHPMLKLYHTIAGANHENTWTVPGRRFDSNQDIADLSWRSWQ